MPAEEVSKPMQFTVRQHFLAGPVDRLLHHDLYRHIVSACTCTPGIYDVHISLCKLQVCAALLSQQTGTDLMLVHLAPK
jgi:hypothetical protein